MTTGTIVLGLLAGISGTCLFMMGAASGAHKISRQVAKELVDSLAFHAKGATDGRLSPEAMRMHRFAFEQFKNLANDIGFYPGITIDD